MEGFRHRAAICATNRTLIIAFVSAGIVLVSTPALADNHRHEVTSTARSNSEGVGYSIRKVNRETGQVATASSGVQCQYQLQFGNIGTYSGYWKRAPSKTSVLAHRTCTDGTDEFTWVNVCDFMSLNTCPADPVPVDPVVLARRVRDNLPVPGLSIASNPQRGLVALKTWFWIQGGGRPISDSLSAFGTRVDVEASPVTYRWDFGDGTIKTTTSPGRPYPERSPVKHTYQRSSAGHPDGYVVSVTVMFEVRWRANGGRWRTLPAITRTSERPYPVAESQAVNSRE